MARRLADGSIQLKDGRVVYANSLILAQDLVEIIPLFAPPPAWPFVSGGGGGGGTGTGAPGRDGTQGTQGFQGLPGPFGGPQGSQGFQGSGGQGPQGPQGFQGLTGSGAQGAQGNQGGGGLQGNQGGQGFQGLTGSGAQGIQGPQGISGLQGNQGNQGNFGPQGSGVQGPQGIPGIQGNQGFQGTSGAGTQAIFQNVQENTLMTSNATPTVILSETLTAGTIGTWRVVVDARYNDGSLHASFIRTVKVFREGGGAVLGTENADYTDDDSVSLAADFAVSVNDVQVVVTGVVATNITWKARMGRVLLP